MTQPPQNDSGCEHANHRAEVSVFRLHEGEDQDIHSVVAEVTICCADCGAAFGFRGPPAGFSFAEPRVDVKATLMTLPLMTPAELVLAGPLPGMARGPVVYEAQA